MRNILSEIFQIGVITIVYITILLLVAPIIDGYFTKLDEAEHLYEILVESMVQMIMVGIVWYYLNKIMRYIIKDKIHINKMNKYKNIISIVAGVAFIGLQSHLISKLEYLAKLHPINQ